MITIESFNGTPAGEILAENQKKIIAKFCNTFLDSGISNIDENILIERIGRLSGFTQMKLRPGEMAAASPLLMYEMDSGEFVHIQEIYVCENFSNFTKEEQKAILYHELVHLVSRISPLQNGLNNIGTAGIDEVMTEFYSLKMLEYEGIKLDVSSVELDHHGMFFKDVANPEGLGYGHIATLGNIYDGIYGKEISDGKFINPRQFLDGKFKDEIERSLGLLGFDEFDKKISDAFVSENRDMIIDCYKDAIKLFKNKIISKENFDLYDYLVQSKKIVGLLPREAIADQDLRTVQELEDVITEMDTEILKRFLPEKYQELKSNPELLSNYLQAIKVIRDNIGNFTGDDLESITVENARFRELDTLVIRTPNGNYIAPSMNQERIEAKNVPFVDYEFEDYEEYIDQIATLRHPYRIDFVIKNGELLDPQNDFLPVESRNKCGLFITNRTKQSTDEDQMLTTAKKR